MLMILIDVYVPVVDRIYDFFLDEEKPVGSIIEEMAEMICQKERLRPDGKTEDLSLWIVDGRRKLQKEWTLNENGIRSGMRLLLV